MKNPIITLFFAFLIVAPGSVLAAKLFDSRNVIWEAGNNVFFKYAEQDKTGFGKNAHPVEFTATELNTVLGSLQFRDNANGSAEEKLRPVFSAKQAKLLGQYLASGLKNAKPDQDIVFALENSNSRLLGLKSDRLFAAGRVFYRDDKLNVIVGDYDRPRDQSYEAAYDPTNVGIVRYHFDHGSRAKSSRGFNKTIVKVDGVEPKKLENTQRNNWLVIDVKQALAADARNVTMRKQQESAKKREEIRGILGSEAATPAKSASPSLEERFSILQRLKDKGLITDEEYAHKRKQLLDEL